MPVPAVQYTPVTPARGGLVHATTLARPGVTACGRKFRAWVVAKMPHPKKGKYWVVAFKILTCDDCKREVFLPAKRRGR